MGADGAPQQVMGGADVGHPVAQGLVDGVLQGASTRLHRPHLGPQEPHAEHVGGLPTHIFSTHVDDALQPQQGTDGGGGYPVLTGASLGDDASLAQALGQQPLPQGVVDLVGAGVGQVLPLEVYLGAFDVLRQTTGEVERGRTTGVVAQQGLQLGLKGGVVTGGQVGLLQLLEGSHQGLGDVAAPEGAEAAEGVGQAVASPGHDSLCTGTGSGGRRRRAGSGSCPRPRSPAVRRDGYGRPRRA